MYDRGKVTAGIVIFLVVFLFPIWFSLAGGGTGETVDLGDVKKKTGKDHCVEATEWMKAYHMDLLDDWRDDLVRENDRFHESEAWAGETYEKSLTRTCLMQCHRGESRKAEFCDKCHDYLDVKPNCWTCHVDPESPDLAGRILAEGE